MRVVYGIKGDKIRFKLEPWDNNTPQPYVEMCFDGQPVPLPNSKEMETRIKLAGQLLTNDPTANLVAYQDDGKVRCD